jgi:hypothetical protein
LLYDNGWREAYPATGRRGSMRIRGADHLES